MASPTSWGPTSSFSPTSNPYLNGLLAGTKWGGPVGQGTVLTYSFPQEGSFWSTNSFTGYGPQSGNGEPWDPNFAGSTGAEQAIIRTALSAWSAVANISFREVVDNQTTVGDMRFGWTTDSTAHAYYPAQSAVAGDVWFGRHLDGLGEIGSYAYATVLHEIGHAVGLKHPHEQSGGFNALPSAWNSMEFSIMSYRSYVGASDAGGYRNETWGYAQSPMIYDIQAMQHIYGPNFSTNSGNTVYQWSPTTGQAFVNGVGQGIPGANRVFETIWDGGGVDTYNFSNYATNLSINLTPGGWSLISNVQRANLGDGHFARGNVFNAFQYKGDARSLIENATGGIGHDAIIGNAAANTLSGNGGADTLFGGAGRDRLIGGVGGDALTGGLDTDTFVFTPGTSGLTSTTADVLPDWDVTSDWIDMSIVGTSTNYVEASTTATSIAAAASIAESRFTSASTAHVFLYNAGTDTGYLLSDQNNDNRYETGVVLKGAGAASNLNHSDII
jgi:serralysin